MARLPEGQYPPYMALYGLKRPPVALEGVILHVAAGVLVEPATGRIYGRQGVPIGAVCADGYVRLGGGRGPGTLYAHRVIWDAVNGPIPEGLYIDHLNGQKADNRIGNLEAVTPAENLRRAVAMGSAPVGEARANAKLTAALVREIRRTAKTRTLANWARSLGVDKTTIRQARNGLTWRHVKLRGRAKPSNQPPSTRKRPRRPRR